jgi:lambda family phage portal protein
MRSLLRSQAAGLGIGYNNYGNDLTAVNFSSIRQGALDERSMWRGMQNAMIESWCNWIFEKWLEMALLSRAIKTKDKPLQAAKIDKYKAYSWQGKTWDWIDPSSEIAANEKAIALRIKSRSSVISELTGRDPEDVWNEIASEDKYMDGIGVVPELMAGSPGLAATPNNNSNQDV